MNAWWYIDIWMRRRRERMTFIDILLPEYYGHALHASNAKHIRGVLSGCVLRARYEVTKVVVSAPEIT